MAFLYRVHGVLVASNRRLVGLRAVSSSSGGLVFFLNISIVDASSGFLGGISGSDANLNTDDSDQNKSFRKSRSFWREDGALVTINCKKDACFQVTYSDHGRHIALEWWGSNLINFERFSEFLVIYLLGNIVAIALRLSGQLVLHGNAVHIGNQSAAWIGSSGEGKSTLSAAFLDAGYPLITDDQLVLSETSMGWQPALGIPILRISPKSLDAYSQTLLANYQSPKKSNMKGWVEFEQNQLTPPPVLTAIFILDRRQTEMLIPIIERLDGGDRLRGLLENRFGGPSVYPDQSCMKYEFLAFSRVASTVPVMRLRLPNNLKYLSDSVRKIVDVISG